MKVTSASAAAKHEAFDFIVVGGGSAGATLAARLAEDSSVSVALVEAGSHATELEASMPVACGKLQRGQRDWQFITEPSSTAYEGLKGRQNLLPRGKCLGGCSVLNYMAYVRGAREDFDTWERDFGATGWSWKDMLPFFKKSEDFLSNDYDAAVVDKAAHGYGGPLGVSIPESCSEVAHAFVEGGSQLGFKVADYNNGSMFGVVSLFQQTIRRGARSDTNTAFIASQPDKPNLTVITDAQAAHVLLRGSGEAKQAVGVQVIDLASNNRRVDILARREVVLSCGALQSPHVLMLSGIGARSELERVGIECQVDLPSVGQDMEDHIANLMRFSAASPETRPMQGLATTKAAEGIPWALPSIARWALFGTGLHASSSYDATLFYKTGPFSETHPEYGPDAQIGLFCSPGDAQIFEHNLNGNSKLAYHKPHYESGDGQSIMMVPTLLHPHSRGRVEIISADPLTLPKIHDNFLTDDRDMVALVDMYRKCLKLANTPAMKSAGLGEPVFDPALVKKHNGDVESFAFLEEFARTSATTLYHPTSTCKIGKVVDPSLKVYGVKGLRVADASVMPTVISGNTNAPSIAIGERAADFIKKEYSMKDTVACKAPAAAQPFRLPAVAVGALAGASATAMILSKL